MKYSKYIIVLGLAIALCWCPTAWGNITNGAFETGDLTGWTATGTVGAVTDEFPRDFLFGPGDQPPFTPDPWNPTLTAWLPTEGNYFASLWSTDSMGTDVSTLELTFNARPGLRLEFDYFFDFGDVAPFYDTAMATLSWSGDSATLFEHNTPGHELGDDENVDWTTISYDLPVFGTYTLQFVTLDGSGMFESILGVDNVQVIPAPGALLLGSIGVGLVTWLRRRRTLFEGSDTIRVIDKGDRKK